MLEVRGLHAGYRGVPALAGVDLEVGQSEIVAVVGHGSSGKSTLLRALVGLVPITRGTVRLYGRDVTGRAAEDLVAMGMVLVPERRRLFAGLTVRENLQLGGWRAKQRDLGRVLELFPLLAGRLDRPAGALSGGEQQVCAIARGLMAGPALMLIDELSLGLAPVTAREILVQLPGIAASGTSLLIVDQDAGIALSVAERGYVLETGVVVASGYSGRLLADPYIHDHYLNSA
ncbi:MAG TPA: ABC transporter ATP-binding protein [Streptosporangiaceae bacterium]|nr:ABC transporter ATP-binding protein [Streptosporangiaceae bacterium]